MPCHSENNKHTNSIILVTRNLPPLVGGMERLNWHMADELSRQLAVCIVGPQGSAATKPERVHLQEAPLRPLWKFLLAAGWQTLAQARRRRPQLVLAGSGLTAPIALLAARTSGARAAVYLHGLDIMVTHPLYRAIWLPSLRRMDCVIVNSTPTAELARKSGIDPAKTHIVFPGVSLPLQAQPLKALEQFRQQHDLIGKCVMLSVGRLSTRKGLLEFVQQALPRIVQQCPDAVLVVVGDVPSDALRAAAQTPQQIQAAADAIGIGQHLRFLGVLTGAPLAVAYESADIHVFPVRKLANDPEGFGMVAIEAAAYGVPTVAYATGGVVDAVKEGVSGRLVPSGDAEALAAAVVSMLENKPPAALIKDFAASFAWEQFGQKIYQAIFNE